MNKSREEFDSKLKEAGLATTDDPNFWGVLYDFARTEFGYSLEDFGEMNTARLDALLDRYLRHHALATKGREPSKAAAESVVVGFDQREQVSYKSATSKAGRRRKPPDKLREYRRQIIREVAATGVTGPEYAAALERKELKPNPKWITNESCPRTYPDAYKSKKWRQRINDEKSKFSD